MLYSLVSGNRVELGLGRPLFARTGMHDFDDVVDHLASYFLGSTAFAET